MAGRFSIEAIFKAVDRITAPVTRMQNRVGKFTRSMSNAFVGVNRAVDKTMRGLKRLALATGVALAATTAAAADVVGTGAQFEQTLVAAAVKFPGEIRKGTAAFRQLEDAARRTGSTTEFTASQSASALNFLAMAGFNAESSIAALPGVVNLATTAQIDLATASDIATDSLGAFNLLTKDTVQLQKNLARVSDVMAKTTTRANLSIEQMFEAIKDGAPVGVAAGQSLETIATFAAKMADAGIKGTRAGTGLKNIFLALNAPGSKAAKVMRRLGVQTADADGNIRDAIDVFEDFSRVVARLPEQTKLQVFNEIFGKIPLAAAINLTNAAGTMKAFRAELEASQGATRTMAGVMRDTFQGRLNSLRSAIEGVKITLFGMTSGPLAGAVEQTTAWVRANEQLIATRIGEFLANIILNFESIVRWTVRIAKGIAIFLAFVAVLKTLIGVLTLVNLVMAANPITLIVLGVTALIAAFTALVVWVDEVSAGFDRMPGILKVLSAPLYAVVKAIKFIKDNAGAVSDIGSGLASRVGAFFGFGDDEPAAAPGGTPQVVSPQDRVAQRIDEQRTTNTAEVTIRDETGRAAVTRGTLGAGLTLQPSGAF